MRVIDFGLSMGQSTTTMDKLVEQSLNPESGGRPSSTSFHSSASLSHVRVLVCRAVRKGKGFTPMWAGPEVLRNHLISVQGDMFSFGVLIFDLMTDTSEPFPGLRVFFSPFPLIKLPAYTDFSLSRRALHSHLHAVPDEADE